ncbi:PTS sugar transporter subunit IIA [Neomegalonema sp.]|uniref:PTS sugar transporter subunit IIA n=1 Tax=Neomegalonema sp. TaxID=2039713 RepID=UPI00260BB2A8|nr:PTS sugar transporter subunit IIA [Neomegalonema sp.]MDD2869451.1 PTS sugar transporter subunit IIA [Neomegalonema sp.]
MRISDLLGEAAGQAVILDFRASDKAEVMAEIAARAARRSGVGREYALESLRRREVLAATGVGDGVAIPHARLKGIDQALGLFLRLEKPLRDWSLPFQIAPDGSEAPASGDDAPVDLVFALISPEEAGAQHLKALARISRVLRHAETRANLRGAPDAQSAYLLLTQEPAASRAA